MLCVCHVVQDETNLHSERKNDVLENNTSSVPSHATSISDGYFWQSVINFHGFVRHALIFPLLYTETTCWKVDRKHIILRSIFWGHKWRWSIFIQWCVDIPFFNVPDYLYLFHDSNTIAFLPEQLKIADSFNGNSSWSLIPWNIKMTVASNCLQLGRCSEALHWRRTDMRG